MVTSFEWIRFENLQGWAEEARSILDEAGEYLDETRKDAIVDAMQRRLTYLREVAAAPGKAKDDLLGDVQENRAETYCLETDAGRD